MLESLGDSKFRRGQFQFSPGPQQQMPLQSCDDQASIATLAAKLSEPQAQSEQREVMREFYRLMWHMGHLFFLTA